MCSEEHRFLAKEQLSEINLVNFSLILEPFPRNTAPAIALAAFYAIDKHISGDEVANDPILLVLPADHVITDEDTFRNVVRGAIPAAQKGKLVTFGIVPTAPVTGYGYIERGELQEEDQNTYMVESFKEKPDLENAKKFVQSGSFYWNSGMFLFGAKNYLDELREYAPEIYDFCRNASQNITMDLDFIRIDEKNFEKTPSISIDYAVMERTSFAVVAPLDAGWSDIGSWTSLWDVSDRDNNGNAISGDVKVLDTKDSLIRAESRMVAAVGVKDLVIVETKDAVLVAQRDHAQNIKDLVGEIKRSGRQEYMNQREVFRPWGSYDSLEIGERFQVKRITVKPGAKTSLQMHHHRAEHWIVVKGTAKVTIDDSVLLLTENESTYIPMGKSHRLENPGKIPLELIEVQSGSYLGEDDIVRLEDGYGRV